uniref:Ulp1 protease family, C-terminal catalytic domain containing protein n=1 Tax=Solanum tuberosum TaxID=4113 RepID=M1DT43_SOLTU
MTTAPVSHSNPKGKEKEKEEEEEEEKEKEKDKTKEKEKVKRKAKEKKKKKSRSRQDCGLFVAAYVEFLSDGLQVPSDEISSETLHMRYASLLWNSGILKARSGYGQKARVRFPGTTLRVPEKDPNPWPNKLPRQLENAHGGSMSASRTSSTIGQIFGQRRGHVMDSVVSKFNF